MFDGMGHGRGVSVAMEPLRMVCLKEREERRKKDSRDAHKISGINAP